MKTALLFWVSLGLCCLAACTYTERIRDGKTAFERKQYSVAIPMLNKEFEKAKDSRAKGEAAYMLAESYRQTHNAQQASDWYRKAQNQRFGTDTDLKYARMLQQLQQYDEAINAFRSAGRYSGDVRMYEEQINACRQAKVWLKEADDNPYKVEALATNTKATEFSPVWYTKDQLLITTDNTDNEGNETYKWTGEKFFDLYVLDPVAETVQRYETPFNQAFHQGTPRFSADGNSVLFTECGSKAKIAIEYCKILYSQRQDTTWSDPVEVDLGAKDYNVMHPTLSADGKLLIFACDKVEGFGGYDLYYSVKIGSDDEVKWSEPKNMGNKINTKGNDVFPFLDADTLYFSSDGHPGMGGLDLFKTVQYAHRWQRPENLKAPMNSGGDDFGILMDRYHSLEEGLVAKGYFSSNREGGKGSDDIYAFTQMVPPISDTPIAVPTLALRIQLDGLVKETIFQEAGNPNSGVKEYQDLMGASVRITSSDTAFTVGSDVDGTFFVELDSATDYNLRATKPGYFAEETSLTTKGIVLTEANPDTSLSVTMILEKIFTNQEVTIKNIYYDFDKASIREDAKPPLDSLIGILKQNPQIRIQLSSHTDCRGRDGYNERLSQERAESAVQYLIQNGINPDRLVAKGYGESKLEVNCRCSDCTDDQHQQNRRTTFLVLGNE